MCMRVRARVRRCALRGPRLSQAVGTVSHTLLEPHGLWWKYFDTHECVQPPPCPVHTPATSTQAPTAATRPRVRACSMSDVLGAATCCTHVLPFRDRLVTVFALAFIDLGPLARSQVHVVVHTALAVCRPCADRVLTVC